MHCVLCARCVVGYLGPAFPDGKGDCGTHCVPRHRTAPDAYSVKNPRYESKQTMFHTETARALSVFYLNLLFLPCGRMLPWWCVVFRVLTGKRTDYWVLCRNVPIGGWALKPRLLMSNRRRAHCV